MMNAFQTLTQGRSRFSKALPAPPPGMDDTSSSTVAAQQVSRELPSAPVSFPPRTDSVGAGRMSKPAESPLPAVPNVIPRKAVPQPPATSLTTTPLNLKRQSSISSLLSAYSRSSSEDSPQRSSLSTSITKDSDAALSPERNGTTKDMGREFLSTLGGYEANPHNDSPALAQKEETMGARLLPPPLPLKDPARQPSTPRSGLPSTPRSGLPSTPRSGMPPISRDVNLADKFPDVDSVFPAESLSTESPPRREIWRRRASSKSDRSLAVAELKLAVSHGSTAATAATTTANTTLPLVEPVPNKPLQLQSGTSASSSTSTFTSTSTPNKTLPSQTPKFAGGLPGRNIKPNTSSASSQEGDDMRKLAKTLKGLTSRKSDPAESAPAPTKATSTNTVVSPNAGAPATRNLPTPEYSPTDGQQPSFVEQIRSPVSPLSSPDIPPRDSGASITRRAVGGSAERRPSDLTSQPGQSNVVSPVSPAGGNAAQAHPPRTSSRSQASMPNLKSPRSSIQSNHGAPGKHESSTSTSREDPKSPGSRSNSVSRRVSGGRRLSDAEQKRLLHSDPSRGPGAQTGPLFTGLSKRASTEALAPGAAPPPPQKNDAYEAPVANKLPIGLPSNPKKQERKLPPQMKAAEKLNMVDDSQRLSTAALSKVSEETESSTRLVNGQPQNAEEEEPKLSPEEQTRIQALVSRFPRNWSTKRPNENGIWEAKPLAVHHYNCRSNHQGWLRVKNTNYPIACMTCGFDAKENDWRSVCKTCQVRVCPECATLLTEKKDLKVMVEEVERRKKGKDRA